MPQGARGEHYIPILVHGSNVLVIVACLWFNLAKNTRMFVLCYHCYFIMDFMNPHSTASYPDGWGWTWHCTSASTFITACVGLAISVLIMVLPYPVRAFTACGEEALRSATKLKSLVEALVDHYESDHPTVKVHRCDADAKPERGGRVMYTLVLARCTCMPPAGGELFAPIHPQLISAIG